jgi:hypothetical protein
MQKIIFSVLCFSVLLGCTSRPQVSDTASRMRSGAGGIAPEQVETLLKTAVPADEFKRETSLVSLPGIPAPADGIPVVVSGIPYTYADIKDNPYDKEILEKVMQNITKSQSFSMTNFCVSALTYTFDGDRVSYGYTYSYDRTPASNGGYYSAVANKYHNAGWWSWGDDILNWADAQALLKSDPYYKAVYDIIIDIGNKIDYNWAGFSSYHGAKPIPTPGRRLEVCEGYSNIVSQRLQILPCVSKIFKMSVPGVHAWNELLLINGRKLYVDATWFDNDHIDENTGKTTYKPDWNWDNLTYDVAKFNRSVSYGTREQTHASPRAVREVIFSR